MIERLVFIGLQHVPSARVIEQIKSHEGAAFNEAAVTQDVHRLMATGWFDDVVVTERPGFRDPADRVLLYHVHERPGVASVRIDGLPERESRELLEASPVQPGDAFDER